MELNASSLFAGFVFGVFGLYLLRQGKKNGHPLHILIGLALMIYPYFVSGSIMPWVIGVLLLGFAYYKK